MMVESKCSRKKKIIRIIRMEKTQMKTKKEAISINQLKK